MDSGRALRVAVMGAGGVGGYFGGRLAQSGCAVSFIARGAHLEALRARGLKIQSPLGNAHVEPIDATDDPGRVGPVDVVMFTVKLYDCASAAASCKPLIGPDTIVVSFLNGIDSEDVLAEIIGAEYVAGGVARISASVDSPGRVTHHGEFASLEFGKLRARNEPRLQPFLQACRQAGIRARISTEISAAIWRKFVFLSSFAAITSLTRLPIGPIRRCPPTFALLERAVREVAAVASAKGVDLGVEIVDEIIALARGLDGGIKSSMLVDLERGRRLELRWLSGAVVRVGGALSVSTPVHELALAALLPFADGQPEQCGDLAPSTR